MLRTCRKDDSGKSSESGKVCKTCARMLCCQPLHPLQLPSSPTLEQRRALSGSRPPFHHRSRLYSHAHAVALFRASMSGRVSARGCVRPRTPLRAPSRVRLRARECAQGRIDVIPPPARGRSIVYALSQGGRQRTSLRRTSESFTLTRSPSTFPPREKK
eukprot:5123768-Pleurochrysis_carterae.AAC.2